MLKAAATPLIPRRYWLIAILIALAAAAILLWMGRPLICTCGEVRLWVGEVHGPDNSQHIADWYTPATSSTASCSIGSAGCSCAAIRPATG